MTLDHHARTYVAAMQAERCATRRAPNGDTDLERLVHDAAGGDESAWAAIVRRFTRRLVCLARLHRVGTQDVDDIVQATWVHLFEDIHNLRNPNALPGWLDTTARRESIKRRRASAREHPLSEDDIESIPAADELEDEVLSQALRQELAAALSRLPSQQRALLETMCADEKPSYEAVSERLGMPVGSIGPTRARAIERLQRDERLLAFADGQPV
jgi:RNA polymerase sigma factor (sigma-70 family)